MLLEKLGFCGGTPVAAMIHTLDAVLSCKDTSQTVVGGYATALLAELASMRGLAMSGLTRSRYARIGA